jgi:hypothetical protein
MKIVLELNRSDIEKAIVEYLKDELLAGGKPPEVVLSCDKEYPCLKATVTTETLNH